MMKISQLIEQLESIKAQHGDLVVYVWDEYTRRQCQELDESDVDLYKGKRALTL